MKSSQSWRIFTTESDEPGLTDTVQPLICLGAKAAYCKKMPSLVQSKVGESLL